LLLLAHAPQAAAIAIAPIARGADSSVTLQAPSYALRSKLLAAKNLDGVWA